MKIRSCLLERGIPNGWEQVFERSCADIEETCELLQEDIEKRSVVLAPRCELVFELFYMLEPAKIKVVILGRNPYTDIELASGIAFSQPGQLPCDSLANIYKEVCSCYPETTDAASGDLTPWVKQGVFLLNKSLTANVKNKDAYLHIWMGFIDQVIFTLTSKSKKIIWILLGKDAQGLKENINEKGIVIEAEHPSPANRGGKGFLGCKFPLKVNQELIKQGKEPIDWSL